MFNVQSFTGIKIPRSAGDLLLDIYTDATSGYSVDKLRTAYTGSAVRVRRSSDNTEQDIGFSGNILDLTALNTFCSGTDGFVTVWYDQQNSNDIVQTNASSQPKIFDSTAGTVIINGKPAIFFDGVDKYMTAGSGLAGIMNGDDQPLSIFNVLQKSDTGYDSPWEFDSSAIHINYIAHSWRNDSRIQVVKRLNTSALVGGPSTLTYATNTQYLNTFLSDGISIVDILNTTTYLNTSINQGTYTDLDLFVIGGKRRGTFDFGDYWHGHMQELVVFPADKTSNASGIQANINNRFTIY